MNDPQPLRGRRVLVTRPHEQAADMVERLAALGAEPIVAPMIRVLPPLDTRPLRDAAAGADSFDWIVFASANAVDGFVAALTRPAHEAVSGVRICAVGPATAKHLEAAGLRVDLVPTEFRAECAVEELMQRTDVRGCRILIPRANIGREVAVERLRQAGADVTEVVAYRTVPIETLPPAVLQMLQAGSIDAAVFTSPSAVRAFAQACGSQVRALLGRVVVATIGPVTSEAAIEFALHVDVQPHSYTVPALIDALAAHFARMARSGDGLRHP